MKKNVAIFIFDDAEVLDFAGPFEVFSITSEVTDPEPFHVFTIAKSNEPVLSVNGMSVNPKYSFKNHPEVDILIISGGVGTRKAMKDNEILSWIKKVHSSAETTLSICSGSRILGALGLLDGLPYCTHHEVYDDMKEIAPSAIPRPNSRFIKSSEKIYTSGGISAGIDLSFYIVGKLLGKAIADGVANYMEYTRHS